MLGRLGPAINTIAKQMMTTPDGRTDPMRAMGVLGFVSLMGMTGYHLGKDHIFDVKEACEGFALYFAGWGAGHFGKGKGEGASATTDTSE